MSQCDQILAMLRRGEEVTPATVYAATGSLACHSRIAELRRRGYLIDCIVTHTEGRKQCGSYALRLPSTTETQKAHGEPAATPQSGQLNISI